MSDAGALRANRRVRAAAASALALLGVIASAGGRARADEGASSIEGRVLDSSNAPIAKAAIEVTSESLTRHSITARDGTFRVDDVPRGRYRVRALLAGFREAVAETSVVPGETARVDLVLQVAAEEAINVSGANPSNDAVSTATGTRYTAETMEHLPVARNYADVVRANPGVFTDRGDTQGGRALAFSIYGASSAENQWSIDGVNTTSVQRGTQGKALSGDLVEEVHVVTGGYPAEYGRALGGLVNVVTRSGGNTFHGGAFVYYDSNDTAAQRRFEPTDSVDDAMRVADARRYDFGANLGGYLVKDRLWFFGAYDRVRLNAEISRVTPSHAVSTSERFPMDDADGLFSAKVTWNASAATSVVGTVFGDGSSRAGASGLDPRQPDALTTTFGPIFGTDRSTWYSERNQGGTDFGVRATQLLGGGGTASIQGGLHRDDNRITAPDGINFRDITCAGGSRENPCEVPRNDPNAVTGGYGFVSPLDGAASSRGQIAGSVTGFAGDHTIKSGGDYLDGRTTAISYWTGGQSVRLGNEQGIPYYMHRFYWVSSSDPSPVDSVTYRTRVLDYSLFAQDSWRAGFGLTLNVGVRWDGERVENYIGQRVMRLNDQWQPRLGVVWDPWRDGATKITGFVGRFSYGLPTDAALTSFADYTIGSVFNIDPVSRVGNPSIRPNHFELGGGPLGALVDSGLRAGAQDELTVGVERLFGSTLSVGVHATYRRLAEAIENRCDLDSESPESRGYACVFINPGSDGRFARGDFTACDGFDSGECGIPGEPTPKAKRIYRGLEITARETLGSRLWIQASYVYSSLRGNYDGGVNQLAEGETSPGANLDFDYRALWQNAYGTLTLDRPHSFRLDGFWTTPWKLSLGLRGFAVSGAPLNKLGFFDDTYGAAIFLLPRGTAGRLPTVWGTDLTLEYPLSVGPATMTLQAYVFNLFNTQIETARDEEWSISAPPGYPQNAFDPNQPQRNPDYGKVTARQSPRLFRAAVRISF